ncbi:MAG TPA: DegV family protein [Solirubrobacteraceae bacterium]|nr:DegV family protein [Solirubrobacteraceae bacterium]
MAVAVVTDTTHYLPPDLPTVSDLHQVSLYVRWGDRLQREIEMTDLDGFYEQLRAARDLPTTSQPSVGDFLQVYEPLVDAGHEVASIHLAAGMSGTTDSARQAAQQLQERGRGRVEVLDSATACGGFGFVALAAQAAASAGEDLDGVLARAREARENLRMWFCIDTLEYLQRGGRVGRAQAWVGGALKIKPILAVESEITPVERVRTSGRAFERMVDYARSLLEEGRDAWMVQHIQAPDQAQRLVERGRELFGSDPLCVSEVGPVIGAHTGPGLIGVGGIPSRLLAAGAQSPPPPPPPPPQAA